MHNNQNSRGYGYSQQPSSSSRNFNERNNRNDRWHENTEWSARDETWRGNPNRIAPPDRGRNESWKQRSLSPPPRHRASDRGPPRSFEPPRNHHEPLRNRDLDRGPPRGLEPPRNHEPLRNRDLDRGPPRSFEPHRNHHEPPRNRGDFQLGRDRAPMPVDDTFLIRYGAKRLNNGNLVDRDGYTLRVRDPDCRAPSPPTYNPGREIRRNGDGMQNGSGRGDRSGLSPRHSRPPSRSGQPHQPGPPRLPALTNPPGPLDRLSHDDLDKKARQQIEMMRKMEEERTKKAIEEERKNNKKKRRQARNEDEQDEYEEVEEEGQDEYEDVVEPPPKKEPDNKEIVTPFGIIKSLTTLANTTPFQPRPSGGPFNGPVITKFKPTPRPDSWFQQYKKNVEDLKEKVYGTPAPPAPGTWINPNEQRYAPPSASSSSQLPFPPQNYHPTPSSLSATPSGASPALRTPSSVTSSPYHPGAQTQKPYPQMDLPPPGVVEFDTVYSTRSPRYGTSAPAAPAPAPSVVTPSSYPTNVNAFGVFTGNAPPPLSQPTQSSSIPSTRPRPSSPSSDSESEDEAIKKLREIIRNHGSKT